MTQHIAISILLAAVLTGPALAGNPPSPKLTAEARDSAQITKRNISKMKLRTSVLKRAQNLTDAPMP